MLLLLASLLVHAFTLLPALHMHMRDQRPQALW